MARLSFKYPLGTFNKLMVAKYIPVSKASTTIINDAGREAVLAARVSIAAAGFSAKWQNALRGRLYPGAGKTSVNAAYFIWHKIPYAYVFERGLHILGKPLLWIPLPSTPKMFGRKHVSPKLLIGMGVKLFTINRPGKAPLLATRIKTNRAKVSTRGILRGTSGKVGSIRAVPLFVGIRSVDIKRRFGIMAAVEKAKASARAAWAAALGRYAREN